MAELLYIDPENGDVFYPVSIHNFDKNDQNKVRIMGSRKLNPENVSYPDKKWVDVKDLKSVYSLILTPEFIKNNTF